jgi:hypothetical protein
VIARVARHVVSAGLAAVFAVPAAHAAEWSLTGNASTSAGADRNPQLSVDDIGTRSSLVFNGGAEVFRRTETTALSLLSTLRVARYPGERLLNGEQAGLDAGYTLTGERGNLTFSGSAARESTQTSELGTTGRTDLDANRDSGTLGLATRLHLTERLSMGGNLSHQHTAYWGLGANTGLYGSDHDSGSLNVRYSLTPAMSMAVTASASAFDSERAGGSSDSQNLKASFNYAIAERLALALSVGPSRIKTRQRTDHGIVYAASFERSSPRANLAVSASRADSPSGSGVLTRRDDVSLAWSRQVAERTNVNVGLSAIRSSEVLSVPGVEPTDVRYLRLSAGVRRQLGEQWSVGLGATGSRQDFRQLDRKANGYEASFNISWSGRNHVL